MIRRTIPAGRTTRSRRGVAAVEAAVVTPMLLILVLGTIEMGTALRASTIMQSAAREAGRLVSTDWRQVVGDGDTPNAKIERDLRNFVTASGLPGSELTVNLTYAEGEHLGQPFDVSDDSNSLELVQIQMQLPYSKIALFPVRYMGGTNVSVRLVLRMGMSRGLSN